MKTNLTRNCKTDSRESFIIRNEKHSPIDSILKMSNRGTSLRLSSADSSAKRRRGLGKKTIDKQ
jgi:hypothetical protein